MPLVSLLTLFFNSQQRLKDLMSSFWIGGPRGPLWSCRMLPWVTRQIWLCCYFVVLMKGMGDRDGGQSLLMMTWVCNPTLRLFSSERGDGRAEDHRGRIVFVNRSESGVVPSWRHTSWLSLFVLSSLICEPKKVHVPPFEGQMSGKINPFCQ